MLDSTGMARDVLQLERQAATAPGADVLVLDKSWRIYEPRQKKRGATLMKLFDAPSRPAAANDSGVIDEQALRDLVAHMVRAELRGSFGERLTTQIRTLVRREVSRLVSGRSAD